MKKKTIILEPPKCFGKEVKSDCIKCIFCLDCAERKGKIMNQWESEVSEYIKDGYKVTVLETYPEIDYALIVREAKYEPFVAAWAWDENTVSWGQGHYFSSILDAAEYIQRKLDAKKNKINWDRMCEIASKAIDGLRDWDEDDAHEYCLNEIEMDEHEMEFFGLNDREDEEDEV